MNEDVKFLDCDARVPAVACTDLEAVGLHHAVVIESNASGYETVFTRREVP